MINIKIGKHLNMDAIIMESQSIRLKILPDLGFKMASIVSLHKDKEFLFQPTRKKYDIPKYGDSFENYDTSGLDEMMPTVDKCIYPAGGFKGEILPDHGDVWTLPWDVNIKDNSIIGKVKLKSLPLEFTKTLSFRDENTIRMDYRVKNLSHKEVYYLWALHGLNKFDDHTEFIFPQGLGPPINVYDDEDLREMDIKYLKNYRDKEAYKFYFEGDLEKGQVGLDYTKDRVQYLIKYQTKINPYLGVWITKGGFKGEYNCALEPSNGFYDSVSLAYENQKLPLVQGQEEHKWTVFIEIKEY